MNEDSKNFIELISKTIRNICNTEKLNEQLTLLFQEKAKKENIMYYKSAFFFLPMNEQKIVSNVIDKVTKEVVAQIIKEKDYQ